MLPAQIRMIHCVPCRRTPRDAPPIDAQASLMLIPSVHIDVDSKRFSPAGTKGNHRSNAITEFISPCGHAGLQLGHEGSTR